MSPHPDKLPKELIYKIYQISAAGKENQHRVSTRASISFKYISCVNL